MDDLKQKAIAYREAQTSYNVAFREYFANDVAELPDDRFWELQAVFRGEVCTFRFGYGRTSGSGFRFSVPWATPVLLNAAANSAVVELALHRESVGRHRG